MHLNARCKWETQKKKRIISRYISKYQKIFAGNSFYIILLFAIAKQKKIILMGKSHLNCLLTNACVKSDGLRFAPGIKAFHKTQPN